VEKIRCNIARIRYRVHRVGLMDISTAEKSLNPVS